MSSPENPQRVELPARTIVPPVSVSERARATLAMPQRPARPYPPLSDHDAWRAHIAALDAGLSAFLPPPRTDVEVTTLRFDEATVFEITPTGDALAHHGRLYFDIHGGALISGGGAMCEHMCAGSAHRARARTWAVDYRMPPDHPYPTPLDDCVRAYRAALDAYAPDDIIVGGSSAGGNLAAALMLRARDEGLPLPAAVVLISPEVDLTESGDSFQTNLGVDNVLRPLMDVNLLYANGHDLAHPYLSPLFGDFAAGFPRTFVQAGTRDLFLSNAVRMHRALRRHGVDAQLHVFEAMPHGGFFGAPEDAELNAEVRTFIDSVWG